MTPLKIIGIGSPFGPDQAGWQVIESLRSSLDSSEFDNDEISLITADRPGLHLLELIKDTDNAILIDAIADKQREGQIMQLDQSQLETDNDSLSSHAFGVAETLLLGKQLGNIPKNLMLFGLCVDPDNTNPADHASVHTLASLILKTLQK